MAKHRGERRVVGSGGRKDKGIRKRKVAREKNTQSSGTERPTKGRHQSCEGEGRGLQPRGERMREKRDARPGGGAGPLEKREKRRSREAKRRRSVSGGGGLAAIHKRTRG